MKILMSCLLDGSKPAAGRVHFFELAGSFAAAGHEVAGVMPFPREPQPTPLPFARFYRTPVVNESLPGQALRSLAHLAVMIRALSIEKPDVIYFRFRSCAPFTLPIVCLLFRRPRILIEQNTWATRYLKVSGYSALVCALSRWGQMIGARCADGIRVSTDYLKGILVSHGIPAHRIFVAGMGADLDRFKPLHRDQSFIKTDLDPAMRHIGFVGHLSRWQGVDVLVQSMSILKDRQPDLRIVIVGDGPQLANLCRLARERGVSDHVIFTGHMPHDEVPNWINCFDIGIGALRTEAHGHMLGTSMKLAEYAACGIPSIAASYDGIEFLLQAGGGSSIPSESPEALAREIIRLLEQESERLAMGRRAREVAEERLSWRCIGNKILTNFGQKNPTTLSVSSIAHTARETISFIVRRLAIYLPRSAQSIWIHGQSSMDFEAAGELIRRLRHLTPTHRILLTSANRDVCDWLATRYAGDAALPSPIDCRPVARRFIRATHPRLVLLLRSGDGFSRAALNAVSEEQIPIAILNADKVLSDPARSLASRITVGDEQTFEHLQTAGIDPGILSLCGPMAFEYRPLSPPPDETYLRREMGIDHTSVVLAETVPADEAPLLIACSQNLSHHLPGNIMLVQPAGRQDGRILARAFQNAGLRVACRSRTLTGKPDIIMMDIPAELPALYAVAGCVIAGGSFSGIGRIVNPVGAAWMGKRVVYGPHTGTDVDAARLFLKAGLSHSVEPDSLAGTILNILCDTAADRAYTERAVDFIHCHHGATERTWNALTALLPNEAAARSSHKGWRIKTRVDRLGDTTIGRLLADWHGTRRIETCEALRARLGHPRHILCLGNGPTSEDPRLQNLDHDRLFRVNWRWRGRGLLEHPDVVLVGHPLTMMKTSRCIYAFGRIEWERIMLLRHALYLRLRPPDYFTLERVPSLIAGVDWHARPTNGALMVLLAAACAPNKITLAGIDLFRHPDGRYPGDFRSQNEPAQVHNRNIDLDIIGHALHRFTGDVEIIGEGLREALASRQTTATESTGTMPEFSTR